MSSGTNSPTSPKFSPGTKVRHFDSPLEYTVLYHSGYSGRWADHSYRIQGVDPQGNPRTTGAWEKDLTLV